MTDMARLTNSSDDDFSAVLQPLLHQVDRLMERSPEPTADTSQGCDFDIQNPMGLLKKTCLGHKEKEYASPSL